MPATVQRGSSADMTNKPEGMNVHSWTAWVENPQFDVQRMGEVARTTTPGDPIGKMVIIGTCSGTTMPTPGDPLDTILKINSGTGVSNIWKCTSVRWQVEVRGGGPPQIVQTEWVTTETAPTGITSNWVA